MSDRNERMTRDAISKPERASRHGAVAAGSLRCAPVKPEPLDEAEAALVAGGQDDDDDGTGSTADKCDVVGCACVTLGYGCTCTGHTHISSPF